MNERRLFSPDQDRLYLRCFIISVGIFIVTYISDSLGLLFYYAILAVLSILLLIHLTPIFVNQNIIIAENEIEIYNLGVKRKIKFCENLDCVVIYKIKKKGYRFNIDGFRCQITPYAYKDHKILDEIFDNMLAKCNKAVIFKESRF